MKKGLSLFLAAVALAAACTQATPTSTAVTASTATATSLPAVTSTLSPTLASPAAPTPIVTLEGSFESLAQRVAAAVEQADAASIATATLPSEIDCRGLTEETPWCPQERLGQVISGVKVGMWRSDYNLFSVQDFQNAVERFLNEAQAAASDGYGSGRATLVAVGYPTKPATEERDLVLSEMTSRGREALLLRSRSEGGHWGIEAAIVVGPPFVPEVLPPGTQEYHSEPWPSR